VGIGCVLLLWALLLGSAAAIGAVVLGFWSWRKQRRALGRAGVFKAVAAAALPFVLLAYVGVAFAGYAVWCVAIRSVDPGIGDGWQVPVGNDHYFCMIDVPDSGYVLKGGCSGGPIVAEITELASAGPLLIGKSRSDGPFLLDTRTGRLQTFTSMDAALSQVTPRPTLQSAAAFYTDRRFVLADAIAALLIAVPAIRLSILWHRWFIRVAFAQSYLR
jgi:hypothetical protein